MELRREFSVSFIFLFALIHQGSAIRCIDCSSLNNSMCIDPSMYDQETIRMYLGSVDCSAGVYTSTPREFFCRKIVQTVLHKHHDPEVRVIRGCGWVRHDHRPCYNADNEDHQETVCQCFTDHCNGATNIQLFSIGLVLSVIVNLKAFLI